MKKLIGIIMVMLLIVTGCSTSDLESYKEAVSQTSSYTQGESEMRLDAKVTFNEEDTTFEKQRELSYFEHIELHMKSQYDVSDGVMKYIANTYYNFGGLGFDIIMYMDGNETMIELPIIEKFLKIDPSNMGASTKEPSADQQAIYLKIVDRWNEVLSEEDVFSGKRDYVMTDKGQLKTTTYTININDAQFEKLKEAALEIVSEEGLVEALLAQSSGYDKEAVSAESVQEIIETFLEDIELASFEGEAFVDFDGRLVKQTMTVDLINSQAGKGEMETMHIEFETNFDHLGEEQVLDFPEVDPEQIIETDNMEDLGSYFPEGL